MRIMVGFQAVEDEEPLRRKSFGSHQYQCGKGSRKMTEEEAKSCSCLEWIDLILKKWFYDLGVVIGKHPTYFIIIPIFVALLLGTGMQRLVYVDDPEYLFSPVDGDAKQERTLIDTYFRVNYSSKFNPSRFVRPGRFAR